MIIGTPREIKNHEYRVGLTPESARELVVHGHRVLVETGAGEGIGAHDRFYHFHCISCSPVSRDALRAADSCVWDRSGKPRSW